MKESDESNQPVSAGRQEIRKRRQPSQPMIDKSQQTEVTEKKTHLPISQSSAPKATLSIGSIPGRKINYESGSLSAQLQQTWTQRKHVQNMTDKSLQTDTIAEKNEIKSSCRTVAPEEKLAAIDEAAPEFLESVQEVEIPPRRHSLHLKTDRSQQTSCTGDWTMMDIFQKEKADNEQQTHITESEKVVIGWPESKEGTQKHKSSGKIFVSEHPESQPAVNSNEEIRQKSGSRTDTQQTKKDAPLHLEDEQDVPVEVKPPASEEISAEMQLPLAEKTPAEVLSEVQPPLTEEAPIEIQPSPDEEAHGDEAPDKVKPTLAEETSTKVQPLPDEEAPVEESKEEVQLPSAEEALAEEVSTEVQPPPAGEAPEEESSVKVQPPPAGEAIEEEFSIEVQPAPAEEAPEEAQPPPTEETSAEVHPQPAEEALAEETSSEVQALLSEEEAPAEEASIEVQPLTAGEALKEEVSTEVQPSPSEEAPAEESSIEVQPEPAEEAPEEAQPPPTEETSAEVHPQPAEEALAEEASSEVQALLIEEKAPAEESSIEVQPESAEEAPEEVQSPPTEEAPAEVHPRPAEEALAEEASSEVQPPPAEEALEEEAPYEVHSLPPEEIYDKEGPAELQPPPKEMIPVDGQSLLDEESFITQISIEDTYPEGQLPLSEQIPEDEALVENVPTEYQSPKAAGVPVVTLESLALEDEPKSEEHLEPNAVPEDSSDTKNEDISFKIEGVIHIELE
uniref:Fibrous sheath CABYR-binding protein n=1 Tax=Sus scrofa TaxID=9823 RepID=A0A8D1L7J8_PIG